jgi:hypothetical protein
MRTGLPALLCFTTVLSIAQMQAPPPSHMVAPSEGDGGVRDTVEGIVIPPIPNAPFTAMLSTEVTRYGADGSSMSGVNQRRIARDRKGRVYQERWYIVPKGGKIKSTMNWIQIADPKALTLYNCSTEVHVCDLLVYDPSHGLSAVNVEKGVSGPLPDGQGTVTWEDLGKREIAGIETVGTRKTTIMNSDTLGNDRPLTYMSEYWRADKLAINLLSIRSSPYFGKQTFTVSDLSDTDPDAQLFELPAGYTINDQRKNPRISH